MLNAVRTAENRLACGLQNYRACCTDSRGRAHINQKIVHILLPSSYEPIVMDLDRFCIRFPYVNFFLCRELPLDLLFEPLSQVLQHS